MLKLPTGFWDPQIMNMIQFKEPALFVEKTRTGRVEFHALRGFLAVISSWKAIKEGTPRFAGVLGSRL